MIFNRYEWRMVLRVMLLFITLCSGAYFLVSHLYTYLAIPGVIIIYQLVEFYRFNRKAQDEVEQFAESIHYRDFSRHFDVKKAPSDLKPIRKGFNDINTTFKIISKEKETQYQYLQKILELVDTGILSYETNLKEIMWMNESLKKMLGIPYLKNLYSLQKRNQNLFDTLISLRPGQSKLVTVVKDGNPFKVLLSATAFQTDEKLYKLIAFQNVNEALDETEGKAWQKLLSVMTHEIMNSVAPISSLADTLKNRLHQFAGKQNNENTALEDLEVGIDTIRRRSEGLLKFAEIYRNLNKITTPVLKRVYVRDLFENLQQLMQPTLEQKNISLDIILKDTDLLLEADSSLIDQVMINLVVNAIEAVKENEDPRIMISAYSEGNKKVVIKVADNGIGIPTELMDKIFVPFFSTKKNGSGIGLSLCKQIMLLHRGNLHIQSAEKQGSAVYLHF
ncbi:MAG: HAMP domain-containing histidine kinase [Chitinophagales bacterium]|nr:HAMP domain-containing histidine kinase [Chitinophagales bacterium]